MPDLNFYETPEGVRTWASIGERHKYRDREFVKTIIKYFRSGNVHEAGAACGHLSKILMDYGWDVTASDFSQAFVDYMKSIGIKASRYDARELDAVIDKQYDNILAQGLTPLVVRDRESLLTTLGAIHRSLKPEGRLISIFAIKRDAHNISSYFQPDEQAELIKDSGLFRTVRIIPHQVTPPKLHNRYTAKILNFLDFQAARIVANRKVMIFEKI